MVSGDEHRLLPDSVSKYLDYFFMQFFAVFSYFPSPAKTY